MGSCIPSNPTPQYEHIKANVDLKSDVIHTLSNLERTEYFITGFLRSIESDLNEGVDIPMDIILLCIDFWEYQDIKSRTEIYHETLVKNKKAHKIGVIGPANSGKSAFIQRFTSNDFNHNQRNFIYLQRKVINVDGMGALIHVHDDTNSDAAGTKNKKYAFKQRKEFMECDAFILCYSVLRKHHFEDIQGWYKEIMKMKNGKQRVIVLCGCKADWGVVHLRREVTEIEAANLARKWGILFMETSAKNGLNVTDVFKMTVRQIRRRYCIVPTEHEVRMNAIKTVEWLPHVN